MFCVANIQWCPTLVSCRSDTTTQFVKINPFQLNELNQFRNVTISCCLPLTSVADVWCLHFEVFSKDLFITEISLKQMKKASKAIATQKHVCSTFDSHPPPGTLLQKPFVLQESGIQGDNHPFSQTFKFSTQNSLDVQSQEPEVTMGIVTCRSAQVTMNPPWL